MSMTAVSANTVVVKVSRPLSPPTAPWLVRSECGAILQEVVPTKDMKKAVGLDAKAYFRARCDDGKIKLISRVNNQSW